MGSECSLEGTRSRRPDTQDQRRTRARESPRPSSLRRPRNILSGNTHTDTHTRVKHQTPTPISDPRKTHAIKLVYHKNRKALTQVNLCYCVINTHCKTLELFRKINQQQGNMMIIFLSHHKDYNPPVRQRFV